MITWIASYPPWYEDMIERVSDRDRRCPFIPRDLLLRFRDAGAKFVRLSRFLAAFRVHLSQKTSGNIANIGTSQMERLRYRCRGRSVSPLEVNDALVPYIARHIIHDRVNRLFRFFTDSG